MHALPLTFLGTLAPGVLLAAAPTDFASFVGILINLLGALVPVVFGLALLVFFWGIAQFILAADDASKRTESKQIMIWGVIALFVMVSVWGLVGIIKNTFF